MPGTKKHLNEILNRPIFVTDYKIMKSKHRDGTECMQMQFTMDDEICVLFTGSVVLMEQVKTAEENKCIPFHATVVKRDKYFSFS